jgi:xylulokinase
MSLLGIDVGTTGCKAIVFSEEGQPHASAYEEYDIQRPQPGWSELDARDVWEKVQRVVRSVATASTGDPIRALAVSSLGEAMVPVTEDRRIIGPSLLNDDVRGEEYLEHLSEVLPNERLYSINGNTLGNHYGLTKLLWVKEHQPSLFERASKFLLWGSFVPYMLGGEPVVDFSLANRTLLFDIDNKSWSSELLDCAGIEDSKLPGTAPSGTQIGTISAAMADELGLPRDVALVAGAHDQCANALGCGAIEEHGAMLGMGTYLCLAPVFAQRPDTSLMIERGLNTEHHAAPERFVTFIYNQGGSLLKWYRDTFAARDRENARNAGVDIYAYLIAEVPTDLSSVIVLPHFTATGPPEFIADSCGVIGGLRTSTSRGDILKGIMEGTIFYIRECVESLPETGIGITNIHAVGGGSKSDVWVQICADILNRTLTRPKLTEAGALGAAILAGVGVDAYGSMEEGAAAAVRPERQFEPDPEMRKRYDVRFEQYRRLWPLTKDYLRDIASGGMQ